MAFLFLFWANFAVADPFKAALESMCAEAQAQVHYVDPNLMDLRSLTPGLPDAIQSYHFWVTVHQALQKLHTAYAQFPALLPEMTPYYHLPSIQASLRYLLIQFNQAARAAYNDLPSLGAHFEVGMPRESIEELSQFLLDIKHRTEIDRVSHPSHPHVLLNVTELERLWRGAYHSSAGYEFLMDHFMDFKGLYDFFNFTLRFYIPGAAALPVTLPDLDDSTWVGRIHRKVVSDLPKVGSGEAPMQILLIEMMDLQTTMDPLLGAVAKERDAVAAARKANAKKNAKKKQRKKRALKRRAGTVADVMRAEDTDPHLVEADEREELLVDTPVTFPRTDSLEEEGTPVEREIKNAEVVEETDDLGDVWIAEQRAISLQKRTTLSPPTPIAFVIPQERPRIHLSGTPLVVYQTAMGGGPVSHTITNAQLMEFLRAIGGGLVSLTARAEPKFAIPNYRAGTENPFYYDRMHWMHGGKDPFPVSRLRVHLRRMLIQSGISSYIDI